MTDKEILKYAMRCADFYKRKFNMTNSIKELQWFRLKNGKLELYNFEK